MGVDSVGTALKLWKQWNSHQTFETSHPFLLWLYGLSIFSNTITCQTMQTEY